jgi:predicted RNA-binding protein (virulence factor B family)
MTSPKNLSVEDKYKYVVSKIEKCFEKVAFKYINHLENSTEIDYALNHNKEQGFFLLVMTNLICLIYMKDVFLSHLKYSMVF